MPGEETWLVDLAGVSKRYDQRRVLSNVSLRIRDGECIALLGHNGAGKTTLLRVISTQVLPTGGTVLLFGRDVRAGAGAARRRIGLLTHESFLYPELTVLENLKFYGGFYPVDETRYTELLEIFRLMPYCDTPAKNLSFGLRRRADMARALLHDPDLLLLDEPFAGLDENSSQILGGHLAARHESGITLVMTSHAPGQARRMCNRIITLEKGRIVEDELLER